MTIQEKADIAKQILKVLEKRSEHAGSRSHSFMLGSLEVLFEEVFTHLSDECVENYTQKKWFKN